MRIRFAKIAGALVAMCCLSAPAVAQAPKTWTHGVIEPKGDAGFSLMASRRGFAEKYGLAIKIVPIANGTLAHKALLAGEVDSIELSPGSAILAGLRGADLRIVGCDWPGVLHGIVAKGNIASIADLRGKRLAISAPGSLPDLVARAIFKKFDVDFVNVKTASLGDDLDRYKALLAGIVDASVIAEELMAIAPSDFRLLAAGRDALPNYVRLCLTVTGRTITRKHDETVRFLAAEIEALRFAVMHRNETIALTAESIAAKPDDPRPAFVFDSVVKHRDVDPEISLPLDKLDWMQNELVRTGNLDKAGDISRIIDASLRAQALEMVGK